MRSTNASSRPPAVKGSTIGLHEAILKYLGCSNHGSLELQLLKPSAQKNACLPLADLSRSGSQGSLSESQQSTSESDSQQKTPERDCQKAIANDVSQEVAQKAVQSLAKGKAKLPQASVGDEAALSVSAQIADLKNQINVGKRKASEKDLPEKKEESKKRQKKKGKSSLKKAPEKKRHPKAPAETEKDVNKKEDTRKRFTSRGRAISR